MTNKDRLLLDLMKCEKYGDTTVNGCYATWSIESQFSYIHRKGYEANELRCVFDVYSDGEPTISTDWHPDTREGNDALMKDITDVLEGELDHD